MTSVSEEEALRLLRKGVAPEGMIVDGELFIDKGDRIESLPDGMTVHGNFSIVACPHLVGDLRLDTVHGDVFIVSCPRLAGDLRLEDVRGDAVTIRGCPGLLSVEAGHLGDQMTIHHCPNLASVTAGDAYMVSLSSNDRLESVRVGTLDRLKICNQHRLGLVEYDEVGNLFILESHTADWLRPKGGEDIHMGDCRALTELPSPFRATSLSIHGCPNLHRLPEDTDIKGDLSISGSGLISIGPGVAVGGDLRVHRCDHLQRVEADVRGRTEISGRPGVRRDEAPSPALPPTEGFPS